MKGKDEKQEKGNMGRRAGKQEQYRKLGGRNFSVGAKKEQRCFLLNKEQKIQVWTKIKKANFVHLKKAEKQKEQEQKKKKQQKDRKKEEGGQKEKVAVWGGIVEDEIEGGQELKETVQVYEQIYDVAAGASKKIGRHISERKKKNHKIEKRKKYTWKEDNSSDSSEIPKNDNRTLNKEKDKEKSQRREVIKRKKIQKTERKKRSDEKQTGKGNRREHRYVVDFDEDVEKKLKRGNRKRSRESSSGKSTVSPYKRDERGSDGREEIFFVEENMDKKGFLMNQDKGASNRKKVSIEGYKKSRRKFSAEKSSENRAKRNLFTDKYGNDFGRKLERRLPNRGRNKRRKETIGKRIRSDKRYATKGKDSNSKYQEVSDSRWENRLKGKDGEREKLQKEIVGFHDHYKISEDSNIPNRRNNSSENQKGNVAERQKSEKKEERKSKKESDRNRQEGGRKKQDKSRKSKRKNTSLEERQKRTVVKKRMLKHYIHMFQNDDKERISVAIKDIIAVKVNIAIAAAVRTTIVWIMGKVILLFLVSLPFFFLYQLLLASPFAVFFPIGNLEAGQVTAGEMILKMQKEFQANLKEVEAESSVDGTSIASVTLQYANLEGDGIPDTYYDVLTVYAVKYNMGDFTLILEEESTEKLQEIFDAMCFYTIDDVESSYEDEEGESYYEIDRTITVTLLSYIDLIHTGYFNKEEEEILCELMKPENRKLMQQASGESHGSSLTESDRIEINKNLIPGEKGSEAVQVAMTKVGAIYSQAKRYEEGYYDCSSLTYRVYLEVGVDLSYQGTNVASYQARKMVAEGRAVAYEDLAPGDLIFWANEPCDSYLSITHVGLYAGNGKTIEASYSKGQVVYRNIWGVDEIVLCARPYD